jgi:hypothetical protein
MTKADKINAAINAIPGICQDGRDAVRKLMEEVTGERLLPRQKTLNQFGIGDVFRAKGFHDMAIIGAPGENMFLFAEGGKGRWLDSFADAPRTYQQMLDHLNEMGAVRIGWVRTEFVPSNSQPSSYEQGTQETR